MRVGGRKVTIEGVLRLVEEAGEVLIPPGSRLEAWQRLHQPKSFSWDEIFPSQVERVVGRLARRGWVEKVETEEGIKVIITESGKKQVLLFRLEEFKPKSEKWDGKWRMVFFDVVEEKKIKRNRLRKYLQKLGFWQMQKSVWVSPYDCEDEVKYLREVLGVPHEVKWGVMEKIENEADLKKVFGL